MHLAVHVSIWVHKQTIFCVLELFYVKDVEFHSLREEHTDHKYTRNL